MRAILTCLAVAVLLVPAAARASCQCIRGVTEASEPVRVEGAPRNLRLRFTNWMTRDPDDSWALRAKGGAAVPAARKKYGPPELGSYELVLEKPLAPNATYELVRKRKGKPDWVYSVITTGATLDTKAPEWAGVKDVRVIAPTGFRDCHSGRHFLQLFLEPVQGDPPDEAVEYAVWVDKPEGPPHVVAPANGGKLQLGGPSACDTYWVPTPNLERIHLFIAAVDRAGNMSPKREVEFGIPPAAK